MDKINIEFLNEEECSLYYEDILEMLTNGDKEFVPPLSARVSTTQANLSDCTKGADGIMKYFEQLKRQKMLVAVCDNKLLAFCSFIENFINDKIDVDKLPDIYISTLIVKPEARGKALTRRMYEMLFKKYEDVNIYTRTWSTNIAHIKILSGFGFETLCVLKDDRGEGIDTVYFEKSPIIKDASR